jgi:hypothetical protein
MVVVHQHLAIRHEDQYLTLHIFPKRKSILIRMQLKIDIVNTKYLPMTLTLLEKELPNVLKTRCFNEENIPFKIEVQNTEIGHLFEHILLENLCVEKYKYSPKRVIFNGRTKWNWIVNPYGSFDIWIDAGFNDQLFFFPALKKSINLMQLILSQNLNKLYTNSLQNQEKYVNNSKTI